MEMLKIKKFMEDFKLQFKNLNESDSVLLKKNVTFKTQMDKLFEQDSGNQEKPVSPEILVRNASMPQLKKFTIQKEKVY